MPTPSSLLLPFLLLSPFSPSLPSLALPYCFLFSIASWYLDPLHHPSSPSHPPITPTPKRLFNEAYSRERKREGEFSFCLLVPATRYTPLAPNHPARSLFRCSATSRVLLDLLLAFLRLSTYSRCSGNFGRIQPSSPALLSRALQSTAFLASLPHSCCLSKTLLRFERLPFPLVRSLLPRHLASIRNISFLLSSIANVSREHHFNTIGIVAAASS